MSELKILDGDGLVKYLDVIETGATGFPHQSVVPDYRIPYAISQILSDDAVTVSVKNKAKSLIKFGRNDNISNTVFETIWLQGGTEAYATGNDIDTISSDDAGDTQTVTIEGHTLSGSDLTFVSQTATLNGQSKVVLTTPLYRANRLYNTDSSEFDGDVYIYEDDTVTSGVPDTSSKIHLKALSDDQQSLKCATSLSSTDYWIVTSVTCGANRNSGTRNVDFKLQVREFGKVFRTRYPFTTSTNSGSTTINFEQPIIIKPNSDIAVIGQSSGSTTIVNASIHGYLASIV